MSEKVLDILGSEVKPGDEFIFHTDKSTPTPSQIYRVITVGEEMVFMGVSEGPYYRESLIHRNELKKDGLYVRYKRPKVEKVRRILTRDEGGHIRWYVDYPSKGMIGAIEVTIVDDKIVKVEIENV